MKYVQHYLGQNNFLKNIGKINISIVKQIANIEDGIIMEFKYIAVSSPKEGKLKFKRVK